MPKGFSVRVVVNVLRQHGFFFVSQSGSHAKYRKPGITTLTTIVPIHNKDIPYGTFRSILRQSKLQQSDFE